MADARDRWLRAGLAAGLPLLLALAAAAGEGAAPAPPAADEARAASVPLEQLLKLPDSYSAHAATQTRGGATQKDWQGRFREARERITEARNALEKAERELEETASQSNTWQVAAPGQPAPTETSPLSFRLTQELKRRREQVGAAETALQDLEIQANLAEVPEDWR